MHTERSPWFSSLALSVLLAPVSILLSGKSCEGLGWGAPVLIETYTGGDASEPDVAADPSGNVVAVWKQGEGLITGIWANRYVSGSGWGTPERIDGASAGGAIMPRVAMDAQGNSIAVWLQTDNMPGGPQERSVYANRFVPGMGWGVAELIEDQPSSSAYAPEIAFDTNGNATVVWFEGDSANAFNVLANRYTPTDGWGAAELLTEGFGADAQLAVDPNGVVTTVWRQWTTSPFNVVIQSKRFTRGAGWGVAELVAGGAGGPPRVVADVNGETTVVRAAADGMPTQNILANRRVPQTGWGPAVPVGISGTGYAPAAAVDAGGVVTVVWHTQEELRGEIWSNRYAPGAGWSTPVRIETDDAEVAAASEVVVDVHGNATAVWSLGDFLDTKTWSNRYTPENGWGIARRIGTADGWAFSPRAAVDPSGVVTVVWSEYDGVQTSIWSNRLE